jgi:hypothetical protein
MIQNLENNISLQYEPIKKLKIKIEFENISLYIPSID